jgi:hypothetical protein
MLRATPDIGRRKKIQDLGKDELIEALARPLPWDLHARERSARPGIAILVRLVSAGQKSPRRAEHHPASAISPWNIYPIISGTVTGAANSLRMEST